MTAEPPATAKRLDLPISGMSCAACARSIERVLSSTGGVEDARVNFATATATVQYDPDHIDKDGIVAAIRDTGYDVQAQEDDDGLAPRLITAAALAVVVMSLGMLERLPWLQLALTTAVMLYPARPFFVDAWSALRHGSANMNSLIALGTGSAFVYSTVETFRSRPDIYFESAAVIVTLILLGRLLERRARHRAGESVRLLLNLSPRTARVERNGVTSEIAASDLLAGDTVVLRPGERAACDGVVLTGQSAVDESTLTGESIPVDKATGDAIYRGTINRFGVLRIEARKVGADTALDRIIALVAQAQNSRAPVARLADTVSGYFTWIVLGIAAVTAAVWLVFNPSLAIANAVAVLIVACPCALGLATPVAIVAGTGRGAQRGILIKNGEALEAAAHVNTVLLDKTGTLTEGKPVVARIVIQPGFAEADVLGVAAAVEQASEHPLARAIEACALAGKIVVPAASDGRATAGFGVSARVAGRSVDVHRPAQEDTGAAALAAEGLTVAVVTIDGVCAGYLGIADQARPESREAVAMLQAAGIEVRMLTGDNPQAAARIANETGITEVLSALLPEGKEAEISRLRQAGRHVAMVGDGINDAPALARANVGIALGTGADIAAEAGDITILRNDLRAVPEALILARSTLRVIQQNLFWAFAYNVVALPIAAGVLYPLNGWLLSPMVASATMAFSSLSVVLNSLRLRRA